MEVLPPPLLASVLHRDELPASLPGRFTPGDGGSVGQLVGNWVGPRACLNASEKIKVLLSGRIEPQPLSLQLIGVPTELLQLFA